MKYSLNLSTVPFAGVVTGKRKGRVRKKTANYVRAI
jgi:hypothetical protein